VTKAYFPVRIDDITASKTTTLLQAKRITFMIFDYSPSNHYMEIAGVPAMQNSKVISLSMLLTLTILVVVLDDERFLAVIACVKYLTKKVLQNCSSCIPVA